MAGIRFIGSKVPAQPTLGAGRPVQPGREGPACRSARAEVKGRGKGVAHALTSVAQQRIHLPFGNRDLGLLHSFTHSAIKGEVAILNARAWNDH